MGNYESLDIMLKLIIDIKLMYKWKLVLKLQ